MAPQKRMMLKADVNRIYDEEVYSEQKIREEKFFVRPTRQRKMKKGKLFSVGMGLDLPFCIIILVLLTIGINFTKSHRLFLQFRICACLWFLYCRVPKVLKDGFLSAFLTFSLPKLQSLQSSFSFHIGAVNTITKCSLPVTAFCRV